jgi:hypothetical protein
MEDQYGNHMVNYAITSSKNQIILFPKKFILAYHRITAFLTEEDLRFSLAFTRLDLCSPVPATGPAGGTWNSPGKGEHL